MSNYYIFDIETYPNIFTFCGKFRGAEESQLFEISDRKNESQELFNWLSYLKNLNVEMVGANNINFDYPIIHEFMINPYTFSYQKAAALCQTIIKGRGLQSIAFYKRIIPQIDLFRINHFDNKAKMTSLKALQFAMRSHSVEDLPFDIRDLNDQEKDELCKYNLHDVVETEKFLDKCEHMIDMRREYLNEGMLTGDVLNFSDVKIGADYMVSRIGKNKCYSGRNPKQTFREVIEYGRIILPKIYFRTQVFEDVFSWFKQQKIIISATVFPKLEVTLAGLQFHFGAGGVHASADNKVFHSDDEYQIIDIDVAGMYPRVAIVNKFAPEHLGQSFVTAYKQVSEDRARYAKGSPRNAAMKLAGNGTYGNSNSPYSPFYDPKFTFSITVNGQLQILQLVEMIDLMPDCELIQANTDGITVRLKREYKPLFDMWCKVWEDMTGLTLEEILYNRMIIRDVNNYISEYEDGKLKRKGAYWYPLKDSDYDGVWNKDFSNFASKKAAEKAMLNQWPVETVLRLVTDPFDFMLRYKTPGGSQLYIGDVKQLKTVRYYVSLTGQPMKKVSPPKGESGQYKLANTPKGKKKNDWAVECKQIMQEIGKDIWDARIHTKNKSKYETRITSVQSGWLVKQCNVATDFDWSDVNWQYYIEEAKKIIVGSK